MQSDCFSVSVIRRSSCRANLPCLSSPLLSSPLLSPPTHPLAYPPTHARTHSLLRGQAAPLGAGFEFQPGSVMAAYGAGPGIQRP